MVRLARGATRGARGKMGKGRGMGPPPPLMARNSIMPPPIPPPRMPPPRMRPLPHHGMRPPFAPPIPPPLPPPHLRPPPRLLPPVPPVPPLRRNLPYPPRPPGPMFPPHGPIPRMPPPPIPPPLMRGRGRLPRGMELRHTTKMRKLGVVPFKPRRGRKNKPIKDKSEGEYFCETCDRGFKTEEKLQEHFSQHVVCGVDGCTLTGHQKIINTHILLQHKTGMYEKICAKDSPEDIAAWINERKRNYPTKKNIEEKVAKRDEMDRRGERIHNDSKRFGDKPAGKLASIKKHSQNTSLRKQTTTNKKNRQRFNKLDSVLNDDDKDLQDSWNGSLPHFPGTDLFPEENSDKDIDCGKGFSDEEWDNDVTENFDRVCVNKPTPLASVLTALNAAYGSSAESSEDEENIKTMEEKDIKVIKNEYSPLSNLLMNKIISNDDILKTAQLPEVINDEHISSDSGPEEIPMTRAGVHPEEIIVNNGIIKNSNVIEGKDSENKFRKSNRKRKRNHKKSKLEKSNDIKKSCSQPQRTLIPKKRLTLLQKLLEPEIRHERNVLLQCIRYIVKNNFFGIGQQHSVVNGKIE